MKTEKMLLFNGGREPNNNSTYYAHQKRQKWTSLLTKNSGIMDNIFSVNKIGKEAGNPDTTSWTILVIKQQTLILIVFFNIQMKAKS